MNEEITYDPKILSAPAHFRFSLNPEPLPERQPPLGEDRSVHFTVESSNVATAFQVLASLNPVDNEIIASRIIFDMEQMLGLDHALSSEREDEYMSEEYLSVATPRHLDVEVIQTVVDTGEKLETKITAVGPSYQHILFAFKGVTNRDTVNKLAFDLISIYPGR